MLRRLSWGRVSTSGKRCLAKAWHAPNGTSREVPLCIGPHQVGYDNGVCCRKVHPFNSFGLQVQINCPEKETHVQSLFIVSVEFYCLGPLPRGYVASASTANDATVSMVRRFTCSWQYRVILTSAVQDRCSAAAGDISRPHASLAAAM